MTNNGPVSKPGQTGQTRYEKKGFKWLRLGGICGGILLTLILISIIMSFIPEKASETINASQSSSSFMPILVIILMVFIILAFLIFYFAFYKLGEHTSSRLLKFSSLTIVISTLVIVLLVIIMIVFMWAMVNSTISSGSAGLTGFAVDNLEGFSSENFQMPEGFGSSSDFSLMSLIPTWVLVVLVIVILFVIFMFVVRFLFGMGLIKIRDKIKLSLVAGILEITLAIVGLVSFIGMIYIYYAIFKDPLGILALAQSLIKYRGLLAVMQYVNYAFVFGAVLIETIILFKGSKQFEN